MSASLVFRPAQPGEGALLTRIALAGKAHWGYPPAWIEAWRPDLTISSAYLRDQPVSVGEIDGVVVGFVGLSTAAEARYLEHLWLRPERIGQGLGRAFFAEAVRLARAAGETELRIKSDPNAEAFYLRMGAVRTGEETYLMQGRFRREVPELRYLIP